MQTVFITGTTTGIGLATARYLDEVGWRVFAGVLPGEDTTALETDASENLTILPVDITDSDMVAATFRRIQREVGDSGLDGLVNNAGIGMSGPMEVMPLSDIQQVMEINYIGHVRVTRTCLPLIRQARGRIVNISSILGRVVAPFSGPYCASKFALEAFSDALRMELRPWQIHVAVIEPTIIQTAIWQKQTDMQDTMLAELPPQARELYGQQMTIMQRSTIEQANLAVSPEQVAQAIHHALTVTRPRTRYVVGGESLALRLLHRFVPDRWRDMILLRRLRLWNT